LRTADDRRLHVSLTSLVPRRVPELNTFAGLLTHEIALSLIVSERTLRTTGGWLACHRIP
jgi:hypothetical protein